MQVETTLWSKGRQFRKFSVVILGPSGRADVKVSFGKLATDVSEYARRFGLQEAVLTAGIYETGQNTYGNLTPEQVKNRLDVTRRRASTAGFMEHESM